MELFSAARQRFAFSGDFRTRIQKRSLIDWSAAAPRLQAVVISDFRRCSRLLDRDSDKTGCLKMTAVCSRGAAALQSKSAPVQEAPFAAGAVCAPVEERSSRRGLWQKSEVLLVIGQLAGKSLLWKVVGNTELICDGKIIWRIRGHLRTR